MFIGYYKLNEEEHFNIYYRNVYGCTKWLEDTFSPDCKDIKVLVFRIKGKTYQEKKNSLEELAKDWQFNFSSLGWSYGELATVTNYFEKNGKRYGLLNVFKENAIC